jgi:hypothetical protein
MVNFSGLRGFRPWIDPQSSKLRRVVGPKLESGEASRAIKKHRQRNFIELAAFSDFRTAIPGLPPARQPFTVIALLPDVVAFPAPAQPPSSMLVLGSAAGVGYGGHAPNGFGHSSA